MGVTPTMKILLVIVLLVALASAGPVEVEPQLGCSLIQAADCFGSILQAATECVSFHPEDWMQCMIDILISLGKEDCTGCICDIDLINLLPEGVCDYSNV